MIQYKSLYLPNLVLFLIINYVYLQLTFSNVYFSIENCDKFIKHLINKQYLSIIENLCLNTSYMIFNFNRPCEYRDHLIKKRERFD